MKATMSTVFGLGLVLAAISVSDGEQPVLQTNREPRAESKTSEKVPHLPKKIEFGEVHEVTLYEDHLQVDCLIDFDNHKTLPVTAIPPVKAPHSEFMTRMREKAAERGIDAYCEMKKSFAGLLGFYIVGVPTRDGDWDPSYRTMEQLKQSIIGYPCTITAGRELPSTWIFRTPSNYGVLQITEIVKKPEGDLPFNPKTKDDKVSYGVGIKLRYKLVKQPGRN